jgi:WD40 repeat protein
MSYSPNGRWLVGGGASRNVQIWRTSDGTSTFTLNHANQALDVAISPDSSIAATATCGFTVDEECTEGSVWLWDMNTGKLVNRLSDFPDVVESVAFSADGSSLIAVSRDGTLRVYDTVNYEPKFESDPPGGNGVMALAPDSGVLATGGVNGDVRLWKVVYRP